MDQLKGENNLMKKDIYEFEKKVTDKLELAFHERD